MRLQEHEIKSIHKVVSAFDKNAKIYLFGSRVDDKKRGGDIDLLLISNILSFRDKRRIRVGLHEKLGEQKIDIVIVKKGQDSPFVRIALNEGVPL